MPRYCARCGRDVERAPLTPRQSEIAALLVDGWSNGEIAAQLDIEEGTVVRARADVYARLHVHALAELVQVWAEIATDGKKRADSLS